MILEVTGYPYIPYAVMMRNTVDGPGNITWGRTRRKWANYSRKNLKR